MPRHPPECPFGHQIYVCGVGGCAKTCSTRGGVKQHIQRQHLNPAIHPRPFNPIKVVEDHQDYDFPDEVGPPGLEEPDTGAGPHLQVQNVSYHPLLDGAFNSVTQYEPLPLPCRNSM